MTRSGDIETERVVRVVNDINELPFLSTLGECTRDDTYCMGFISPNSGEVSCFVPPAYIEYKSNSTGLLTATVQIPIALICANSGEYDKTDVLYSTYECIDSAVPGIQKSRWEVTCKCILPCTATFQHNYLYLTKPLYFLQIFFVLSYFCKLRRLKFALLGC